jgi:hypothetical protein
MLQYLGRLYDHDPDNPKVMRKLHRILLGSDKEYDVDSMMKEASLNAKFLSHLSLPSCHSPSQLPLEMLHVSNPNLGMIE